MNKVAGGGASKSLNSLEPRKAAIACPVIVSAWKPGRRDYSLGLKTEVEPEAEARVAAFFAKTIRPPGS